MKSQSIVFKSAVITLITGGVIGLGTLFNHMARPLDEELDAFDQRSSVAYDERYSEGDCYYSDLDGKHEVFFRDFENGPFLAFTTLTSASEARSHHLGYLPHFNRASCDILREDIKLTRDEAIALEQNARTEIAESTVADSLTKTLGSSKGFLNVRDIR